LLETYGYTLINSCKFLEVVERFLECTKFLYSKVEGITKYSSYYNIRVIYDMLDFREKGIYYYSMCVE